MSIHITILKIIKEALALADTEVTLSIPEGSQDTFGHFSTNIAMRLAKIYGKAPMDLAVQFADAIKEHAPEGFFSKIEAAAPGFVNMWVSDAAWQEELARIAPLAMSDRFGDSVSGPLAHKTVMVEFTDPNPFKLFHIGHLMPNTIGESFARLYEASGAKVVRANYQGDVGLHVAQAIWGIMQAIHEDEQAMPLAEDPIEEKMAFLGAAYARGAQAYKDTKNVEARGMIEVLNQKVYARNDDEVNELYEKGRTWSLDYFETIYARLGTKFDEYYFEGQLAGAAQKIVDEGLKKGVLKESNGAVVFPGEEYGLHTRVFRSSHGLPTYEAKELALNKEKFASYPLDRSVIVTANEIVDYFRVLIKVMELLLPPEVAARTRHVPHGMLRLPTGKMSSRTGDVITADALLAHIKEKLADKVSERSTLNDAERSAVTEAIAVGAIKYSILKQNPGQDIVFDFDKSLSFEGDAGPYLQYAYARLKSVLRKAQSELGVKEETLLDEVVKKKKDAADAFASLTSDAERALIRRIAELPDVVAFAAERLTPSALAAYTYKLAAAINKFYETMPILKEEDAARRTARLTLATTAAAALRKALTLLGMKALEKI